VIPAFAEEKWHCSASSSSPSLSSTSLSSLPLESKRKVHRGKLCLSERPEKGRERERERGGKKREKTVGNKKTAQGDGNGGALDGGV